MKELLEFSITHSGKKRAAICAVNAPTWDEIKELQIHMDEVYPNPSYVFFNASIWDADGKEKLLRPKADISEKSLEEFWAEIQNMLI